MMGWQTGDQRQLFYLFNLERRIPDKGYAPAPRPCRQRRLRADAWGGNGGVRQKLAAGV